MSITANQTALASDFVSTSAGAGDSGKVPKLNGSGVLDTSFLTFKGLVKSVGTTYNNATASGSFNIAHTLGVTPKLIRISAYTVNNAGAVAIMSSVGTYDGTTNNYIAFYAPEGGGTSTNDVVNGGTGKIIDMGAGADGWTGVATFDSTNVTITTTKVGTPTGTTYLLLESFA
jgi:hypothetical protein